jgi:putative nucleotidyltransferase with HDIG domain
MDSKAHQVQLCELLEKAHDAQLLIGGNRHDRSAYAAGLDMLYLHDALDGKAGRQGKFQLDMLTRRYGRGGFDENTPGGEVMEHARVSRLPDPEGPLAFDRSSIFLAVGLHAALTLIHVTHVGPQDPNLYLFPGPRSTFRGMFRYKEKPRCQPDMKRIAIDQLRVGMYVVGCDRPWLQTPFLIHTFLVKTPEQIQKLIHAAVRYVDIDPEKGADCTASLAPPQVQAPVTPASAPSHLMGANGMARAAEFAEARRVRQKLLESVRTFLRSVQMAGAVDAPDIKQVTEQMVARTIELDHALLALIRTRDFDPHLYDHVVAVSIIAVALGRAMGLDDRWLHYLAEGALLHDIGLVDMPDRLLRPGGPLTDDEQRAFDAHVQIGVDLLRKCVGVPREVVRMVEEHHAAHVAQGSDDQLLASCCRLLKVVDAYDQLLSGQGGRDPLSPRDALRRLYVEAQQDRFDLKIVSQLIALIGIYPLYSLVELSTGQRGIVVQIYPADLLRPIIVLTHEPNLALIVPPRLVDLSNQSDEAPPIRIVGLLDAEKADVRVEEFLLSFAAA